jgi:hypothetical protein
MGVALDVESSRELPAVRFRALIIHDITTLFEPA